MLSGLSHPGDLLLVIQEVEMKLKPIDQQVVVVVGATSGIGKSAALRLAEKGAKLVVAGRSQEALNSLVEEVLIKGGKIFAVKTDVTDYEQVKTLAEKAVENFGRIDTWVNVAAVTVYATFEKTEPEEFAQLIHVNLLGQIYGAKAALPHLKKQGGALIQIGSIESRRSFPYHSAYAASKHGIVGFIDSLRLELQKEEAPVSVTTILPGSINTPFFDKALTRLGVKPQPLPPVYKPELVARAIEYAAQRPVREIVVGGAGKAFVTLQAISPRLTDAVLRRVAFKGQRTDQPKTEHSPSNIYGHTEGFNTTRGSFNQLERSRSFYTWTRSRPVIMGILAVSLLGFGAYAASRTVMARRKARQNWWERLRDRIMGIRKNNFFSRFSRSPKKSIKKRVERKLR
jgi:NAD(P)-dependent dehydrogenase (short-subunit alcohol dehydrogenase family)